ncbi:MAG: molecular chaperone TorD family protein [Pseudomonadota bacterium]
MPGQTYLQSRAEAFLILARAFHTPREAGMAEAFATALPDDLEELAGLLAYPVLGEVAALRAAAAGLDDDALLRLHAGLFLTPPSPVTLNVAAYIDGGLLGRSSFEIERWYERHGVLKQSGFHDLADDVTAQLEFAFLLFAKAADQMRDGDEMDALALALEARRFLAAFAHRWTGTFTAAIQKAVVERDLNPTFLHLARILEQVVAEEIAEVAARSPEEAVTVLPAGSSRGLGAPTAEDLAHIALRLEARGLSFSHIRERPEWDEAVYLRRKAAEAAGDPSRAPALG